VADLSRAGSPRPDHFAHGRRLTEGRDAVEPDLALFGEPRHRREDDVAYFLDREALALPLGGDVVVELEQVDALAAQAAQTLLEPAGDGPGRRGGGNIGARPLRAEDPGRLQRTERAPQVPLRLPAAIAGRGVEVVDPQPHRARARSLALGHAPPDQQPA